MTGHRPARLLTQVVHVTQAETNRAIGFDGAVPLGDLHVNRMKSDAAPLRESIIQVHVDRIDDDAARSALAEALEGATEAKL